MTTEEKEEGVWILCVVVLVNKKPREYANFYLAVNGDHDAGVIMQNRVSKVGFVSDGVRYFPDQIESLMLKPRSSE